VCAANYSITVVYMVLAYNRERLLSWSRCCYSFSSLRSGTLYRSRWNSALQNGL